MSVIKKASCELLEYEDGQGVCSVETPDGYELPRVGFPEEILKYHGLLPGDRFFWFIGNRDSTCEDIVPDPLPFAKELPQ
jgi:hypothetical protein